MKKSIADKPKMPEPRPTITIPVTLTLASDFSRFSNGSMFMKMADTCGRIVDERKEVGEAGCAIGGAIFVQFKKEDAEYSVRREDLVDFWKRARTEHRKAVAAWMRANRREKK